MDFCRNHQVLPAAGKCVDCGESFCAGCLDGEGRCVSCREATERFLDGFATALNRWEADLREQRRELYRSAPPAPRRRFTLGRVLIFGLALIVLFYSASFLLNYHLYLGNMFMERGNLPRATAHLEKAAARHPDDPEINFILGNLYFQQGFYDEAIMSYSQTILLDSLYAGAYNNLAWIYTEINSNLDQALTLSKRSLRLEPDNPVYLDTLAEIYLLKKDYFRALTYLRQAVDQKPDNLEYYKEKLEKIKRLAYSRDRMLEV
jgi:tetratricopeptide (TPR) repeat protein